VFFLGRDNGIGRANQKRASRSRCRGREFVRGNFRASECFPNLFVFGGLTSAVVKTLPKERDRVCLGPRAAIMNDQIKNEKVHGELTGQENQWI
jgi:hypothetical protein